MTFLVQEGKIAVVLRYVAKLALFLCVPGIHLLTIGKRKIGWAIILLLTVLAFVSATGPFEPPRVNFTIVSLLKLATSLMILTYLYFLIYDLKNLGKRIIPKSSLAIAALVVLITIWPYENYYELDAGNASELCLVGCEKIGK